MYIENSKEKYVLVVPLEHITTVLVVPLDHKKIQQTLCIKKRYDGYV
jgi:hypothetical protein